MPEQNAHIAAFNRGVVSTRAMGRIDIERLRLCAEEQTNILPDTVGNGVFRPGTQFLGNTASNAAAKQVEFIKATDDTAVLEFTNLLMRVWDHDDTLVTRGAVSTTVVDGNMSSAAGWTDASTADGDVDFTGGFLTLSCPSRGGRALVRQTVVVAGGDANDPHALRVVVTRGPVTFRVGTAAGLDEYVTTTELRTGEHSLAFTPTGNFVIEIESDYEAPRIIDSCQIEAAGVMTLPTPYTLANLSKLRWDQSGDVIFMACQNVRQRRIERRNNDSWSVCEYHADDGPFTGTRTSRLRMKADDFTGLINLVTDRPFFKAGHVGALFRIFQSGQRIIVNLAREDTYAEVIRVFGYTDPEREVDYILTGTWVGTITVQRSFDGPDTGFTDFATQTANGTYSASFGDVEGVAMWIRIGFKPGGYTSGTATLEVGHTGGGSFGIARVLSITDTDEAVAEAVKPFLSTEFSEDWREGMWSGVQGYPTTVQFYEGRLWWFGINRVWGSVSDAYESFDEEEEEAIAPINRTIATGPTDNIHWSMALQRLLLGTAGSEVSIRATSFDEPLAVDNFNLKNGSDYGSADIDAVKVDQDGIFIARDGVGIMGISFESGANDYQAAPIDTLSPEIGGDGIVTMAVQRRPETRVHMVREDGKVVILTFNPQEELRSFVLFETEGEVEDVVVLPGVGEDRVYYIVNRLGNNTRFRERFLPRIYAEEQADIRMADCGVKYDGVATTTPTGWSHLNGQQVVVWADGAYVGTKTVAAGGFTLDVSATDVYAGLFYRGRYKSAKLAYASGDATALLQTKVVQAIGLLLRKTHVFGCTFGPDFDHLDSLPTVIDGVAVDATADLVEAYDNRMVAFPGRWDTDARVCIQMAAPLPCTLVSLVIRIKTEDRK